MSSFPPSAVQSTITNWSSPQVTEFMVTCPVNGIIPGIRLQESSQWELMLENGGDYDLPQELRCKLSDLAARFQAATSSQSPTASVTLPRRYVSQLSNRNTSSPTPGQLLDLSEEGASARERDLTMALKWIHQEILHMMGQDVTLLRQFTQLQDSILQLRGLYDLQGSCSDLSSLGSSTGSLNEQTRSPGLHRLLLDTRSFWGKAPLSLPNSPRVTRYRWGSQELV